VAVPVYEELSVELVIYKGVQEVCGMLADDE
jgi:hypothetical protein